MARKPGAYELIIGTATDPVFGPVVLFGEGGTAVELIDDKSLALPPLNMKLARELIDSTRVARRLRGYRDRPAADLEGIAAALVQISQLVADIPEIVELDINPLVAGRDGVLALDARVRVTAASGDSAARLAIRPYPEQLEERAQMGGRELLLRPIRPEDEPMHKAFIDRLEPSDIRFRFFGMVRDFPHTQLARLTQIDYDREMAFIAVDTQAARTLGVVRTVCDPDNINAELAIIVSSEMKGEGLGRALLAKMIDYCRARGTRCITGEVLSDNETMLALARKLGFVVSDDSGEEVRQLSLRLQ